MKSAFQITGLEEYLDALHRAGENINNISRDALAVASEILVNDMKSNVPIDTGNLLDHIKIKVPTAEGNYNYREIGIIHDIEYTDEKTAIQARAVEFGSVNMSARPFIRPAISKNRRLIMNIFRNRLKAAGLVD